MLYLNILRNNKFILSEDKRYSKRELFELVSFEMRKNNYYPIEFVENGKIYKLIVKTNDKVVFINLFLKNITGAGWADKPEIKRCQVSNFKKCFDEVNIKADGYYNLILGYYNYDDNPILVGWDAYRYLNHNTIRSCYVTVDALKRGYEKKLYECVVSSQKCWIFTSEMLKAFIDKYIQYISDFYKKG